MIRRPPRSTQSRSSAASDVYKRQQSYCLLPFTECDRSAFYGNTELAESKTGRSLLTAEYVLFMKCFAESSLTKIPYSCITGLPSRFKIIHVGSVTCLLYTSDAADDLLC